MRRGWSSGVSSTLKFVVKLENWRLCVHLADASRISNNIVTNERWMSSTGDLIGLLMCLSVNRD